MKRAIVVMGIESSGTRLLARIMLAGGCMGDGDHGQRYDTIPPVDDLIMIRKHRPCPGSEFLPKWASSPNIFTALEDLGYICHAVIMSRGWQCTVKSAVAAPHVASESEGYSLAMRTWREIMIDTPAHVPFTIINYESLVTRPDETISWLFARLGLNQVRAIEPVEDGNNKYYE